MVWDECFILGSVTFSGQVGEFYFPSLLAFLRLAGVWAHCLGPLLGSIVWFHFKVRFLVTVGCFDGVFLRKRWFVSK